MKTFKNNKNSKLTMGNPFKKIFLLSLFMLLCLGSSFAVTEWVIVGDSAKIGNSSNGYKYTLTDLGTPNFQDVRYVWKDSQWVVVGASGSIYTSPNGYSWTSRISGFGANQINALYYSEKESLYVVVGGGGQIATSTNGITWTLKTTYVTTQFNDVSYNNKYKTWFVVGNGGKAYRSTNNFQTLELMNVGLFTEDIKAVRNSDDDDLVVAVGVNGRVIRTSNGGDTWTLTSIGVSNTLQDVVYNNPMNKWYIVGDDRKIFATYNFNNISTWTIPFSLATDDIYSIDMKENYNDTFMVGTNGQIVQMLHNGTFRYFNNTFSGFGSSVINKIKFKQEKKLFYKNITINNLDVQYEDEYITSENDLFLTINPNRKANITYVLRDTLNNYNIYNNTVLNVNSTTVFANLTTGRYTLNITLKNGWFNIISRTLQISIFDNIIPSNNLIINSYTPINDNEVLNSNENLELVLKKKANCDLYIDNNKILNINEVTSYSYNSKNIKEGNHAYYWYCEYSLNNILYYEFSRTVLFTVNYGYNPSNIIFKISTPKLEENLYLVSPCINSQVLGSNFYIKEPQDMVRFTKFENNEALMTLNNVTKATFCLINGVVQYDVESELTLKYNVNGLKKQTQLGTFDIPSNVTKVFSITLDSLDLHEVYTPEAWDKTWASIIVNLILFGIGALCLFVGLRTSNEKIIYIAIISIILALGYNITFLFFGVLF